MSAMDREPALVTGGLVALFSALITAAHGFGWIDWSPEQSGAVAAVLVIILPPIQAMITRKYVSPVARVATYRPDLPRE
jgi:hypothetical protein